MLAPLLKEKNSKIFQKLTNCAIIVIVWFYPLGILVMARSIDEVIAECFDVLEPVLKAWKLNHPAHIKDEDIPASVEKSLFNDIYRMGYVIFTSDEIGQNMEVKTLSEVLGKLVYHSANVNEWEDFSAELHLRIKKQIKKGKHIEPSLPKSIEMSRAFDNRNNTHYAKKIELLFNELLDLFVLRDGNITDGEIQMVKRYEALLNQR